ncbi:uncharacterized protein [Neodiprion pinetum]|uniref:uncharacterized protein n=1 Tax=Neodiprion pinetum TaxID=441929 RepID=UPI001EDD1D90|nr:uncharacterized protein LOC124211511 [Neodiprion pinetum]
MVKKRSIVWNYYNKKVDGAQVIAFCKFCDQSYIQNATRMERHMERCPKCPEDVRQQFIQVAHSKKNKGTIQSIKKTDAWSSQEASAQFEQSNVTDTELDNLDDWGYKQQIYTDVSSNNVPPNIELVMQTGTQWANRDGDIQSNESSSNAGTNREWDGNRDVTEAASGAGSQERGTTGQERKTYGSKRISPCSLITRHSPGYFSLQNKIYQEQLLEKRAARRTAELELRRKTLELERFQWEYERDKAHSELRWAHETRMMQLKEERERQIIDQSRSRLPHVI